MLEKLFTSKTRTDILKLFLLHPDERFYGRQIAAMIKKNSHGVLREVDNLAEIGLLEKSHDGNRVYFQIRKKCPIFRELRAIFLKTAGITGIVKKQRY